MQQPMPSRRTSRVRSAPSSLPSSTRLALVEPILEHPPRSRKTALLLCLFFGWLGCHRFYVGRRSSGRLYLFTGGIFFLGVIADLILILLGSFEDGSGKPLG